MNNYVLCFGNISFDLIRHSTKNHLSYNARLGGSVCNTAVLLKRLGLSVSLISKIGTDKLSNDMIHLLNKECVNTDHIIRDKRISSSLAFANIDKNKDSSYIFYNPISKDHAITKKETCFLPFASASAFHTGSSFAYNKFTYKTTLAYMSTANKKNVFVSFDPNWREARIKDPKSSRKRVLSLLKYVDLLKLSEEDLFGISGKKTIAAAFKIISPYLKGTMVITKGPKGSCFYNDKNKISLPAFDVDIIDTIGAGDAFTAGLIYRYLLVGKEIFQKEKKENLRFASAVSALVCAGEGATEGLKNIAQVNRFLQHREGNR